jgi:hypothetical protein
MQIDNTFAETSSLNRKPSDDPNEIFENYTETVKNDHNDENVYEIDPVITWETLKNYRETSDCEPFNIIIDKFQGSCKKKRFPDGFWDSKISHKLYMLILRIKLRSYTMESLYKINKKKIGKNYGYSLLSKYNGSPSLILTSLYPKYEWLFWKFGQAPTKSWDSGDNQLQYMSWLGNRLEYTTMEDWFKISKKNFEKNYGGGLLSKYNGSPYQLLTSLYPKYEWHLWKFISSPKNTWDKKENQLEYLTWLGEKLCYTSMEDWYNITVNDFNKNYGGGLLVDQYNGSPYQLLTSLYAKYQWLFWKFSQAPQNSWDSKENKLKYIIWLGKQLGYTTIEDWYKICKNDFYKNYGGRLLCKYNGSPCHILSSVYPNYEWLFWKFTIAPQNSWDSRENQLKYITWLGEQLGYTTIEDWYQIKQKYFSNNYGHGLLSKYNGSPYQLLTSLYPEHNWLFWKFTVAPNSSWENKENQLQYMNWLGEQLGYTTIEDWYKITKNDFEKNYGCRLCQIYNSSPYQLLKSMYPEYEWLFWKFGQAPQNSWDSKENQLKYMNRLSNTLGYTTTEDWYKITVDDFRRNFGGAFIMNKYNSSPYQLLSSIYPNFEWERSKFMKQYSEQQIEWLNFLQKYYGISVQHACNDGEYRIPETRYYADGFCRDTNTIYEYHGDYWHGNPRIFPSDDFNKTTKCTYGELYDNTCKRESEIRGLGYNLVVIWESDWIRINNAIRKLQKQYSLRKNN